ncbi:MAG: YeeE/YedE family protein [Hyphomicrobiaceae bacterium]|nr:YeeE/YedE family protein [Hyphomicrobiaceae bacterium]
MDSLRELLASNATMSLAIGGLIIGFVFGFVVYRTNFCSMGSLSDMLTFGDYRRFRSWLLAIGIAIVGVQLLRVTGAVDLSKSMYHAPGFNWLGNIIGGLMFGVGMVFAGGCASRNLVRAGSGDLRALLVLIVVGIFAYMTIGGLFGPVRAELQNATEIDLTAFDVNTQAMDNLLSRLTGLDGDLAVGLVTIILAGSFLAYCLSDKGFRSSVPHITAGLVIGLCIVAGWALTGLAYDEFGESIQNPVSLTFVRPSGDALEYLMRFTAQMIPGFGVATVFGALIGAFFAAKLAGRFHIATFADSGDTLRNLLGGMLMGVGGVLALGCTIGQAVTGLSTLAIGSLVSFAAIIAGGIAGIKSLERLMAG